MNTAGDMKIRARLSSRPLRRLGVGAALAAVLAGSALGASDVPGLTTASAPTTPAHSETPSAPASSPGRYVSTEFASGATAASSPAASKPVPPSTAPINEILAQPGHYEHTGPDGEKDVNVCSYLTPPGYAHCDAHIRTDANGATTPNVFSGSSGGPYDPAYLQSAYNAPSATGGNGQTVAIAIAN